MTRKGFLKRLGMIAGGVGLAASGFGGAFGAGIMPSQVMSVGLLGARQRRFAITYALAKVGEMTPDRLERALFESGVSEAFDLSKELAAMVEEGVLTQSVGAEGLVYRLAGEGGSIGVMGTEASDIGADTLAEVDARLAEVKAEFEAEKDYMALYTESSTGMVPVFLSIREGASVKLKLNLVVDDVATAKTVTRNWRKNARRTQRAIWESVGEGLPFPDFSSIRRVD